MPVCWTDDARLTTTLTTDNTGCDKTCAHCGSTKIVVLNQFQEMPEPGYHVECDDCETFWDEYPLGK